MSAWIKRSAAALICAAALIGVVLQYRDFVVGKEGWAVLWSTIDYVSLFTIESNLLVAILTACVALGRFEVAEHPVTAGAACLYVIVAGVTYLFLLSPVYHPEGLTLLAVNLTHYVVPPNIHFFWLLFAAGTDLKLRTVGKWLLFFPSPMLLTRGCARLCSSGAADNRSPHRRILACRCALGFG
jgi:hypothetical protein